MTDLHLLHLIRRPVEVSGRKPLLLLLHGIGSNEHDLFSMGPLLDKRFFVASARAPIEIMPGGYAWFNIEFLPDGTIIPDLEQAERSKQMLVEFIDQLVNAYDLDADRVYLMGFSQGAMMSLGVGLTRPDKVARVVAMSGRLPEQVLSSLPAKEALGRLEILVTHGSFDNVLPIFNGHVCRDKLRELGVSFTYKEYPMAHEVTMPALADVNAWLKSSLDRSE